MSHAVVQSNDPQTEAHDTMLMNDNILPASRWSRSTMAMPRTPRTPNAVEVNIPTAEHQPTVESQIGAILSSVRVSP